MSNIFIMTVWPFAEENLHRIRKMIQAKYTVIKIERLTFSCSWEDMIKLIYLDDKIKPANLLAKVKALGGQSKFVYLIYIDVPKPKYYNKPCGRKLSGAMAELKKEIRAKFGPKKDATLNPLHIPDNMEHCTTFEKAVKEMKR